MAPRRRRRGSGCGCLVVVVLALALFAVPGVSVSGEHVATSGEALAATHASRAVVATSPDLLYSPGNWYALPRGEMRSVNPGAYLRTIFSGATVQATFDVTLNAGAPFPLITWRIDGAMVWRTASVAAVVSLAPGRLAAGAHTLELMYRASAAYAPATDRWITPVSSLTFTGLVVDSGATLTLPMRKKKTVLIYGDSISEGLRDLGARGTDLSNSNARLGYAYQLRDRLDAEVGVIAFGGAGLTVGGSGHVPALRLSYNLYYQGAARSLSRLSGGAGNRGDSRGAPDLVIYEIGTNDVGAGAGATAVQKGLQPVLMAILAAAPMVKQVVLQPFNASPRSAVGTGLAAAGRAIGSSAVTYVNTTGWINAATDTSDGLHPWAWTHAAKILRRVTASVAPLLRPPAR